MKIDIEEPTYEISISDSLSISGYKKPPNWFHRKMMGLVFGWKFKILSK